MEIRPGRQDDVGAICALDAQSSRDDRRRFIENSVATHRTFVAVIDGVPVGYIVIEYSFFSQGFISMVAVQEAYRRQGIASELIRHVESQCETEKLFTSTNQSNGPMQQLLVKLGYAPSGVINNLDDGDPEVVYYKRCRA